MSNESGKGTGSSGHLPWLTVARAFAALWVVLFHYAWAGRYDAFLAPLQPLSFLLRNGHLAVDFFFVLSGFILTRNYYQHSTPNKIFWIRRAARIVPATLIAMVLSYWLLYNTALPGLWLHDAWQQRSLALNVLFLQSLLPQYVLHPNGPAWSLSVEMLYYLSFPFWLWLLRKHKAVFYSITVIWLAGALLYSLRFHTEMLRPGENFVRDIYSYHPLSNGVKFLLGMCCARVFMSSRLRRGWVPHPLLVVSGIIILLYFFQPLADIRYRLLYTVCFMVLILSIAAHSRGPLPRWAQPLYFLGEISFSIYIYQLPVHEGMLIISGKWLHLSPALLLYIYITVLIGVAAASYFLLELPLVRRIGRSKHGT